MKKIKLAVLAVSALALAGCGNGAVENPQIQKNSDSEKAPVVQEQNRKGMDAEGGNGGIIGSMKEAMGLGKTMKCTYKIKNAEGDLEAISYVDGKKYKTEMAIAGNMTKMIFDENAMYTWSEGQKQGMKMAIDCMEELNKNKTESGTETNSPISDPTGEKAFENAMDVKCEETGNVDFSLPTDVQFTDQCEMLKGMMKNLPAGIPGGVVPSPKGGSPMPVDGTPEEPTL